jgi:hypothetical protein
LFSEPAFKLFGGRAQSEIGLRADQIDHRLGLSEVHFAVEKGALGEFARTCRAGTGAHARLKDLCGNQRSSVATDLDQILSGVTGRRAVDSKHHLIDKSAFVVKNLAKVLHARLKLRRRLFAIEDLVRYLDRIRPRDAHKRDGPFPGWRGDGSDSVGNGHNPSELYGNRLGCQIA